MLGQLHRLSAGTQGVVYRAPKIQLNFTGSAVYKEYKPLVTVDYSALHAMVRFLGSLTVRQGSELVGRAAWPISVVKDRGCDRGFIMPEVSGSFSVELFMPNSGTTKRRQAEFQTLLNGDDWLARRRVKVTDRDRYDLLIDCAKALSLFHHHDIAVGDFSPKNLLFSLGPEPRCYFVDCDSMSIKGRSVLKQLETPDWDIRAVSVEPLATAATDVYKFGLLALRLFAGDQSTRDIGELPRTVPREVREVIKRSILTDERGRRAADDWIAPLRGARWKASTATPRRATSAPRTATTVTQPGKVPPRPGPAPQHAGPPVGFRPTVPPPPQIVAPVSPPRQRRRRPLRAFMAVGAVTAIGVGMFTQTGTDVGTPGAAAATCEAPRSMLLAANLRRVATSASRSTRSGRQRVWWDNNRGEFVDVGERAAPAGCPLYAARSLAAGEKKRRKTRVAGKASSTRTPKATPRKRTTGSRPLPSRAPSKRARAPISGSTGPSSPTPSRAQPSSGGLQGSNGGGGSGGGLQGSSE